MRITISFSILLAVSVCAVFAGVTAAQQPDADQIFSSAIEAQQRGDYQTAIREYRQLLELRPNTVEAKVNLGAALVHMGDFDAAIAMYKSALPLVSQKNAVLLDIALAYYKKGDFAHAGEQFEGLHAAQPRDVRIAILLSDTDLRLGKSGTALAVLEPLAQGNSDNLDFQYAYGSALIKAGKRRDGVERIEKVARLGHSADAYMLAGSALLDLNEFESARRDLDAALALNPKLPGLYTLDGIADDKTGDQKDAEVVFREALKEKPDDFEANLYLGAILYKRRDLDQAKPYLDRALQLNPSSSMARYEAAMLKSTSGQYAEAAQELERLEKDDPNWLEPHVELATLYYKLHRPADGAREREIVDKLTAEQQAKGPGTQ